MASEKTITGSGRRGARYNKPGDKGDKIMIEIHEMSEKEIEALLQKTGYGHFACAHNNRPYVVPIHYIYEAPYLYFYTTDGKKTDILKENPYVCLQVEEVIDRENWKSVIVSGKAEEIKDKAKRESVVNSIRETNPTLTPALGIRWVDNWIRENVEAIYRIIPEKKTGRVSVMVRIATARVRPAAGD